MLKKNRLALATAVYWFLLAYIVTLLVWWFIALETKNRQVTGYKLLQLQAGDSAGGLADLAEAQRIAVQQGAGLVEGRVAADLARLAKAS